MQTGGSREYSAVCVKREFYFRRALSKLITGEEVASVRAGFYQGFNCFSGFLPPPSYKTFPPKSKLVATAFSDIKILGICNLQNRINEIELSRT